MKRGRNKKQSGLHAILKLLKRDLKLKWATASWRRPLFPQRRGSQKRKEMGEEKISAPSPL